MNEKKREKEAIEVLKNLGYEVKLSKPTTKKTFEVEIETLNQFFKLIERDEMMVKEAMQEALDDWIKKKR